MYRLYCDRCEKEITTDRFEFSSQIKIIDMDSHNLDSEKVLCGDCKSKLVRFMKGEELKGDELEDGV